MSRSRWINVAVDLFDDEKMLLIESMPNGYKYEMIWVKLLCLAGKMDGGGILTSGEWAYTAEMIASVIRMDAEIVRAAIDIFKALGMMEEDDGVLSVSHWARHQEGDSGGGKTSKNEYMREYMRSRRERRVNNEVNSKVNKVNNEVNKKVNKPQNSSADGGSGSLTKVNNEVNNKVNNKVNNEVNNPSCKEQKKERDEREREKRTKRERDKEEREKRKEIYKEPPLKRGGKKDEPVADRLSPLPPLGKYKNVFLTGEEMAELQREYPADWSTRIERLSEYMDSTGKTYSGHLSTIRRWARTDWTPVRGSPPRSFDADDFFKNAVEKSYKS